MYSMFDLNFWVNFLYFIFAVFIAFYIPGSIILRRLKLDSFKNFILSSILGLSLFSLQGFLFGYLHIRNLTYIYLLFFALVFLKIHLPLKQTLNLKQIKFKRPDLIVSILITVGLFVQLSSVFPNGIFLKKGLYFCCGVPDTLFHLSLTNELIKNFPPNEPAISGIALHNYHYLSNLSTSELVRIFKLPLINTQYQYMAVFLSLLLGLSSVVLSEVLGLGKEFKRWFIFLIYFSGDIIFLLPFLRGLGLDFSYTTFENASSLWISPTRFYSLVLAIGALSLMALWFKRKDWASALPMTIVIGSLIGFKVYVGFIFLIGLAFLGLKFLLKKDYKMILPLLLTVFISVCLYLPVNISAGGVMLTGFWRFEDFAAQNALGISSLELARRIFIEHGNYLRAYTYDVIFAFLYIFFSGGILLLGFLQSKKSIKKLTQDLNIVLISGLAFSCILGFFFIQKIGGANSSQFLISIYLIGSIYAALSISYWLNKINSKVILIAFTLLLIIIGSTRVVYDTVNRSQNLVKLQGTFVSKAQLDSYNYLKNLNPTNIILVYDETNLDCIFITFISNLSTFDCTSGAPSDRGVDLAKRKMLSDTIFYGKNQTKRLSLIKSENIKYLYISKMNTVGKDMNLEGFKKVYDNPAAKIYKINL